MGKLTDKQEMFCKEYLIDLNATQAAIRAGYSKKTANEQAGRLLVNVSVQSKIYELKESRSNRIEMTSDGVLKELKNWVEGDYTDLMMLTAKQIKELAPEIRRLITGFKRTTRRIPGTDEEEIQIEIKFIDKIKAMEMISKHIGFYEKDNSQSNKQPIIISLGEGTKPVED
jgi:phage terminase small subunit|tara:strand:- start:121 stop:633 length:513 start_codon:yes stop_codon:yes gene_type:complete